MHSTPLHAPSVMHIFPYFYDFYSYLHNRRNFQLGGLEWMQSVPVAVEIDEVTQIWNSTPLGPSLCAESNAHFSEFLLIFQHGSMSTEKPTPCVCVCEVFEKTQCGGDGWKERKVAG